MIQNIFQCIQISIKYNMRSGGQYISTAISFNQLHFTGEDL